MEPTNRNPNFSKPIPIYKTPAKDQPDLKIPFLQRAVELVLQLKLDIDPDDSPWLDHLNLTPRQKEDRRRAFWNCYLALIEEQATCSNTITTKLKADKIKLPSTIRDPYILFLSYTTSKPLFILTELVASIRYHHRFTVPTRIQDILASDSLSKLHALLHSSHLSVELNLLLIPTRLDVFTQQDQDSFFQRMDPLLPLEASSTILLNLLMQSSICLVYRPKLYLSALKCCSPLHLTASQQYIIHHTIAQTYEAACKILHLFSFFVGLDEEEDAESTIISTVSTTAKITNTTTTTTTTAAAAAATTPPPSSIATPPPPSPPSPPPPRPPTTKRRCWFHKITHNTCFYSLFEAFLVFWFMNCRMHPDWRRISLPTPPTQAQYAFSRRLMNRLSRMLAFMKDAVEYSNPDKEGGVFVPLIVCMEGMLKEMGSCCADGDGGAAAIMMHGVDAFNGSNDLTAAVKMETDHVEELVLGMKVVSLGVTPAAAGGVDTSIIKEPRAFLGLLGMEVGGGIRWPGPVEESWRLFWKLYS